jgi:general secretion pathway protein A
MYQEFYGLRDIPFSLAPDPRYLFRTESLLEVFANLQYGIENGKGIVVVTGEVGCGKTTILRSMLQSLDRSVLAAYIFNPLLSTEEFFDLLASEFRLPPQASKASMLRTLGHVLMARHAQGLRTVLVVDEAHLLPKHLLEEIRLLLNFETNRDKLLQIILCGQPELHDLLARTDLRQLKQRVSLKCAIKPLTPHETSEYIRWRLRIAGARDEGLFEPAAIQTVHRYAGGIPRIINNICDNALLTGFAQGSPRIAAAVVETVVEELDLATVETTGGSSGVARTMIECGDHAADHNVTNHTNQPAAPNVHYIRRDAADTSFQSAAPPARFVRQAPAEDDAETPLKYFSPFRVTRRA